MSIHPFTGAATDIKSLLEMEDVQFIECAYRTLLNRAPDIDGFNYYLNRLRSGKTKFQVIEQLYNSAEAKAYALELPGLNLALFFGKFYRLIPIGNLGESFIRAMCSTRSASISIKDKPLIDCINVGRSESSIRDVLLGQKIPAVDGCNSEFDNSLKKLLARASEVFWSGSCPPYGWMKASPRIYDSKYDYRLPPNFHQRFELVYLTERDLGLIKAWPLVLDEALRLLAPGGVLVIRFSNTPLLAQFELKNLIASWGAMEIVFEHGFNSGLSLCAFKNTLSEPRPMALKGFSFGLITDGRRPELVREFIDSVFKLEKKSDQLLEVIVCGPDSVRVELCNLYKDIIFVRQPDNFENLGWITKKKNLIVKAASYENIVVAHDRYVIPADFLRKFQEFGGDYSVLVCRQTRLDGRRMPDWVTLGCEWNITTPATLEYGDWTRHVFINGGIILAKTEVLKRIPWNELLFWGQAEDVELTRRLRSRGYVPRLARDISVISATMRQGMMNGFDAIAVVPDRHMLPGPENPSAEFRAPTICYKREINFRAASSATIPLNGVYVDAAWNQVLDAIELQAGKCGEITFKLPKRPLTETKIIIKTTAMDNLPIILANDIETIVSPISDIDILVEVPAQAHAMNNITRLHFFAKDKKFGLHSLTVTLPVKEIQTHSLQGKRSFRNGGDGIALLGDGWSQPEDWGTWLQDDQGDLSILSPYVGCNLMIEGYAKCFVRPPVADTIIGVIVNGIPCGYFVLKASFEDQKFNIEVPEKIVAEGGMLKIIFVPQDPCSPVEAGFNQDPRRLSMGIVSLEVKTMDTLQN